MQVIHKEKYKVPVFSWCPDLEPSAEEQIDRVAELPYVEWFAVMSDCHTGFGMPIGGVAGCNHVVSPSMVGVDIGCGVFACKSDILAEDMNTDNLKKIMGNIRKRIPVGMNWHKERVHSLIEPEAGTYSVIESQLEKAELQLGTLGGGNHFIEIQKDNQGFIWYMIHSGSRNIGKQVADHYIKVAKELNTRWYSQVDSKWDLAFLPIEDENFDLYMREMEYAVGFALQNRQCMASEIEEAFWEEISVISFDAPINIPHNYAAWENHHGKNMIVHRKGATQARKGQRGVIPGSQGTSSYIVEGLGNPKSLESCSHGAGRAMGRKQAQRTLNLRDEIEKLDKLGVVHGLRTEKDLDEAASAYKNIDEVMENQKDLVEIVTKLVPLGVVKG